MIGRTASIDDNYIAALIPRIKAGDSNAIAEFYAATHQDLYRFADKYLHDPGLDRKALDSTYVMAYKSIYALSDDTQAVLWLKEICFRICYNLKKQKQGYKSKSIKIGNDKYLMDQVLCLPFLESQALILKYKQNCRIRDISRLLDMSTFSVNRYIRSGKNRLNSVLKYNYDD